MLRPTAPLLMLAALLFALFGCTPAQVVVDLTPGDQALQQTTVIEDGSWLGSDRVALIDVSGFIINAQKPRLVGYGENPVSLLHEQLEYAARDKHVKAVVLRMNTPGGTVTASDAMYREVRRFRTRTGKPVVALLMDVTTSGGYYVACASDRIVTYPTAVTGSIGVIIQTFSVKPALSRWGVQTEAITSGPNKEAGSPLSKLTEEHRAILQGLVDDFYKRFVNVVRHRRPNIPAEHFDEVTDGRVMSGEQAVRMGLADRTGDIYNAFAEAKAMAQIKRCRPGGAIIDHYKRFARPMPLRRWRRAPRRAN